MPARCRRDAGEIAARCRRERGESAARARRGRGESGRRRAEIAIVPIFLARFPHRPSRRRCRRARCRSVSRPTTSITSSESGLSGLWSLWSLVPGAHGRAADTAFGGRGGAPRRVSHRCGFAVPAWVSPSAGRSVRMRVVRRRSVILFSLTVGAPFRSSVCQRGSGLGRALYSRCAWSRVRVRLGLRRAGVSALSLGSVWKATHPPTDGAPGRRRRGKIYMIQKGCHG